MKFPNDMSAPAGDVKSKYLMVSNTGTKPEKLTVQELMDLIPYPRLSNELGQSTTQVISQKTVTDELNLKADKSSPSGAGVIYSDDERLLKNIDYSDSLLPLITDPDNKILFGWDKTYNKPVIPYLIKALRGLVDLNSLAPDVLVKFNQLDSLSNTLRFISNEDWILASIDTANKVIWGINRSKQMYLFGKEISTDNYYGFTFSSDEDWIIRYTDKENKVLWGIDRNFKVYPTDKKIEALSERVLKVEEALSETSTLSDGGGDSNLILDLNYKGFFKSLAVLLDKYPISHITYTNSADTYRPSLLTNETTLIGNLDQRSWYANVGGYFAFVRWNGTTYQWHLSDAPFIATPTVGMKISLNYNSLSSNLLDELKKAYLTNSITERNNTDGILEFSPDLIIVANAGYQQYKDGITKSTYIASLDTELKAYIDKVPYSTVVVYSTPNVDTGYLDWIADIQAKCEAYSIQFVNLYASSGINQRNKNLFLVDDKTLNQIASKRLAHRIQIQANSIERVGYSNKKDIPVIYIDTENGEFFDDKPKSTKMKMTRFEVDIRDSGLQGFEGILVPSKDEIRGRGNSTWGMEKKPYRLKFDKKVSFFGNAAEKNWVLLAVHADKTSIRPSFGHRLGHYINDYRLANGEDRYYVPTEQLVELVINGRHDGLYCFTDHVSKVTTSRVNIPEPTPEDIATLNPVSGHYELNSDITIPVSGGFLIELEADDRALVEIGEPIVDANNIVTGSTGDVFIHPMYGNNLRYFACKTLEFYNEDYVTAQSPNGIVLQSYMNYIENFVTEVNTVLKSSTGVVDGKTYRQRIEEYIDLNTFIDFYFLQEIAKNPDGIDFSSIYYNKDRDKLVDGVIVRSKLKAGPLWDVDLAFGNYSGTAGQTPTGWFIRSNPWIYNLLRDPNIKQVFIDRWHALNLTSVWSSIMDELATKAYTPALKNNIRWSNPFKSYFEMNVGWSPTSSLNYELQLSYFRQWTKERINWINNNISNI